jgi:hypothetical protein
MMDSVTREFDCEDCKKPVRRWGQKNYWQRRQLECPTCKGLGFTFVGPERKPIGQRRCRCQPVTMPELHDAAMEEALHSRCYICAWLVSHPELSVEQRAEARKLLLLTARAEV